MKISLVNGILLGSGGVGILGAGGYLAWRSQQPSDVKSRLVWEGLSVADGSSLGVYKAIYLAKHNQLGFSSFVTASDKDAAAPLLKDKCDELLRVDSASDKYDASLKEARRWCLVPEKKTIEISLLLEDVDISSTDDDYKNIFALNKENKTFIDTIKGTDSTLVSSSGVDVGLPKVKAWCEGILKKTPIVEDLKSARAWCIKPDSSLNAFMDKQGFKPVDANGWESKFASLNADGNLTSDLSSVTVSDSNNGAKLKTWCEGKNLGTASIHSLSGDLEKIKNRCFVRK